MGERNILTPAKFFYPREKLSLKRARRKSIEF